MSADRLLVWLEQMAESAELARAYVEGMDREAFFRDKRTQQAVILNLLVLGEIAAKLIESEGAFIAGHPAVPWANMKGMRNRIAHGYFELDIGVVWETAQRALPVLTAQLPAVLEAARARRVE